MEPIRLLVDPKMMREMGTTSRATVAPSYSGPYPRTRGECYHNAITWACTNFGTYPQAVVVHGYQIFGGLLYGHAWVEVDHFYVDPGESSGETCLFYSRHKVDYKQCSYYRPKRIIELVAQHGHLGPYHDIPPGALFIR